MMSRTLVLLAALLLAGCATPAATPESVGGAPAPAKIVLAIQPTDNAASIQEKATELETFLEARMAAQGVPADVEIIVPLTYVGVVEALRFGHADAALMSAWPAVMANKRAGAEIVLAEQREVMVGAEPLVAPYYYSYYIVKEDSPYQTLADVKGKRVAYPSATSTSGYVFPVAKLVQDGLVPAPATGAEADAKQFFSTVSFAGGYAQAWEALQRDQVDVTVTAGDVNAKLYTEIMAGSRVIATQGPIPSHGVVFAKDLQGAERDALKAALLELKGEQKDLMRKLVSGIFVEFKETTTDEHAAGLADALTTTGFRFSEKLG